MTHRVFLSFSSQHCLLSDKSELFLGHCHNRSRHVFFVLLFFSFPPFGLQSLPHHITLSLYISRHSLRNTVKRYQGWQWFCLSNSLCDWSRKPAPPSQPIKGLTQSWPCQVCLRPHWLFSGNSLFSDQFSFNDTMPKRLSVFNKNWS